MSLLYGSLLLLACYSFFDVTKRKNVDIFWKTEGSQNRFIASFQPKLMQNKFKQN